ncbi:MAG: TetR/AcrR family transcriptional regulator, partial [Nakamurella sp.]
VDVWGHWWIGAVWGVWALPSGAVLAATMRSMLAGNDAPRAVPEFISVALIGRIRPLLTGPPAETELRLALVSSQLVGVMVGRYLLRLAPLAGVPADDLIASVGPVLQGYLTGDLPPT